MTKAKRKNNQIKISRKEGNQIRIKAKKEDNQIRIKAKKEDNQIRISGKVHMA
jgi:F0F1-type ATP synthase membrane subunit b/b'